MNYPFMVICEPLCDCDESESSIDFFSSVRKAFAFAYEKRFSFESRKCQVNIYVCQLLSEE